MNKRYKFKLSVHIIGLSIIIFEALLVFVDIRFTKKNILDYILIICILSSFIGVIVNLFTYYDIRKTGIRLKSMIRCIDIYWVDVYKVEEQPAGRFVKFSVGIFAKNKKISITPWTKNYKELLKLVVNECEKNKEVRIDSMIYSIIES
ncbi:hypothetical protein [Clostridium saccharoperbutylacetonicum]|uniref:hypothetical protein n=1 Tax=Clostridium saccharoperbutylacetonicum TaxID=36745 RepID=UPI000983E921|nr:hypothetical protein [Clostridium saccharoperbutylacetonicum]AQR94255.1 hypothetical protein CLSAP_15620 [Clostridium saccharoperbutylacetonicum]NSB29955.1 hypothetical protein [Clostridium saccharoperbutylacetonicum]